jgi:hypothetical protein
MSISLEATRFDREEFRALLRLDAGMVAVSAASCLAFARPIDRFLGLGAPGVLVALGAIFLPYGGLLAWLANRPRLTRKEVTTPVTLNAAWVIASAAMLISGRPRLTTAGVWTVAGVAIGVGLLAVAQTRALRRMA